MRLPVSAALLLLLSGSLFAAEDAKPDPQRLLEDFMERKTERPRLFEIMGQMAELGDAAIAPTMAQFTKGGMDEFRLRAIIEMLTKVKSPAAAQALLAMVRAGGRASAWAMQAVSAFDLPEVREFLLGYKPKNDDELQIQLRSLTNVPGADALRIIAGGLASANNGISTRARQILVKRKDDGDLPSALEASIDAIRFMEEEKVMEHMLTNALAVAAVLPDGRGADQIISCLESAKPAVSGPSLLALSNSAGLLKIEDIRTAALEAARNEPPAKVLTAVLGALRKAKIKEGLSIAAACLEHQDKQVSVLACDAMSAMSGKNLGRDPARWKAWWEENK